MRGIRFLGDKRSEVIDYPDEEPEPGYVLLKMRSSGMCGSDLHRYRMPMPKEEAERDPVRPGHEPCGEVAVLGKGVERSTDRGPHPAASLRRLRKLPNVQ